MIDSEKKNDITKIISMTQFEFQLELDKVRLEQKAIDDAELHQRFEKVLNGQKWDLIDKACQCYCDNICEKGRIGMCYHKNDGEGQVKSTFKYNECNELQVIRRTMEARL